MYGIQSMGGHEQHKALQDNTRQFRASQRSMRCTKISTTRTKPDSLVLVACLQEAATTEIPGSRVANEAGEGSAMQWRGDVPR